MFIVGISKFQYQGIMALFDSMDRMNKARPYRKYRPCVPYKKHYKEWWHFAYKCIIEEEVKRKRNAWDWNYILNHRKKCRTYEEVYQTKLQNKKVQFSISCHLFSITIQILLLDIYRNSNKIGQFGSRFRSSKFGYSSTKGGTGSRTYRSETTTTI